MIEGEAQPFASAAEAERQAAQLQAQGRHAEALEAFRAAGEARPDAALPLLGAAISYLALGDAAAALTAASEACWRDPQSPRAHYAYGQAFAALGQPGRAERAFAAALQLEPRWADAWVNYGVALYRQGRLEDAKSAMRQALVAEPGHAAAASNLAAFLRLSGEAEAAEKILQELVATNAQAIGARINLAAELLQEERAEEALGLLTTATPPAEPELARPWRLQLALALLQLNRSTEARAQLEALAALGPVPPALAPLWRWRLVVLALVEGRHEDARREAEDMEAALAAMGAEAIPEHAIMARFDLAKFWSMRQEPARAMAQWTEGHRLLSTFQPFSRQAHRTFVDASIAAMDKTRLQRRARAGNDDEAPVFIVGMPRSGTTLIEQILAAHAQAHGAGERAALGRAFHALGGGADEATAVRAIAALDAAMLDRAARAYLSELHALAPDKTRIVDKMPGNFLYLGLAALLFPKAKFIHCRRDPRDVGLSIFTFRFHGAHGYAHDLSDLGWWIGEHDRLMAHWKTALPGRILEVKLSDWVTDFDATLTRVLNHLGLPPDENCARFHAQESRVRTVSRAQVRQPINARGLGRWRAYAAELTPLIAELETAGSLTGWD